MIQTALNKVEQAMADVRQGRMVIIQDDQSRENEGDLVCAAEMVTGEHINFMARNGCGLICTPMLGERLTYLELPQMVNKNEESHQTAFTVSVDALEGVTTGISAYERATTIRRLIDADAKATDFVRPGHVFPLRAKQNGVLERRGQTEASIDLMRLAGLYPAAVICEIMKEDGHMAREQELIAFSHQYGINMITVDDVATYRRENGYLAF
ncbi:3,4-dihydroxy-2-butanone-4-phosphate synthase [Caldalkalibacillus salinus]|uniref:3,4-dihydroxy-2-butanone-4-phosphate synthase n=1 Tax=Caldalkalibacillus salinus TaxID=2803787 RepID=UPI0019235042|nr:3,4-dihydroxy-2-butanone-4-phosphate synthase [Caldalkalibacillus salinus]